MVTIETFFASFLKILYLIRCDSLYFIVFVLFINL